MMTNKQSALLCVVAAWLLVANGMVGITSVSAQGRQVQPTSYAYLGCYADQSNRDVSVDLVSWSADMTVETCYGLALAASATYFSVQDSGQCFAGNSYGRYGLSTGCNQQCTGNSNEICGGTWANSVYQITTQAPPSCPSDVTPLTSSAEPYIDATSSTFNGDHIHLTVRFPASYQNQEFNFVGEDSLCSQYNMWSSASEPDKDCFTNYTQSIPWSTANPHCGVVRSINGDEIWYTAYILANATQQVSLSDGTSYTRTVSNLLSFVVRFPTKITLDSNSFVVKNYILAPYNETFNATEITAGIFSWAAQATPLLGTLVLVTHSPSPYYFTSPSLDAPSDTTSNLLTSPLASSLCPDLGPNNNYLCVQYWQTTIVPAPTRCDFTGEYDFVFQSACQNSVTQEGDICSPHPYNVTVHLKTSNYCGFLTPLAIGLTGSLRTYSDSTVLSASSNFGLGDTLYAKLTIDAGQATITDVSIDTVILQPIGQAGVTLASNGVISSAGSSISLALTNDYAVRTATLSFILSNTYFPLADQASTLATIQVIGLVTFANTQTRRLLMLEGPVASFKQASKLHHLSQMTKTVNSGNALALRQMKNVANAEGMDLADSALLKLLLKQKMGVQTQSPSENQILLQVGEGSSASSGVRAERPFMVGHKGK